VWTNLNENYILSFHDEDNFLNFEWASDLTSINSNLLVAVT
jgi:hypothetical protein